MTTMPRPSSIQQLVLPNRRAAMADGPISLPRLRASGIHWPAASLRKQQQLNRVACFRPKPPRQCPERQKNIYPRPPAPALPPPVPSSIDLLLFPFFPFNSAAASATDSHGRRSGSRPQGGAHPRAPQRKDQEDPEQGRRRLPRPAAPHLQRPTQGAAPEAHGPPGRARPWHPARLPARDQAHPRQRCLEGRAPGPGPRRPPRRDHRPRRPQDGRQRPQLGRVDLHGRLRG
jgi:hypothetical protein